MYVDPDPECADGGIETVRAAAIPLALAGVFVAVYLARYGTEQYLTYTALLGPHGELLQFGLMVAILGAHAAGHAAGFVLAGSPWRTVSLRITTRPEGRIEPFSVSLRPTEPVRRWRYSVGLATPGVALGFVPAILGVATGNPLALFVGVVGLLLTGPDTKELLDIRQGRRAVAETAAPATGR